VAPSAKFYVYKDKAGEWRWQLKSSNDVDILGDSGEGYKSEAYCYQMVNWIRASAHSFPVAAGTLS
jgi:uncharacterized protein YegP (UPF0339 family)